MRVSNLIAFVSIAILTTSQAFGQESGPKWDSGLEVEDHSKITVLVEDLAEDAESISLTKENLQNKTEVRLRQAGIDPQENGLSYYLYINVNVTSQSFSVDLQFIRITYYLAGSKQFSTMATTWETGSAGTHGGDGHYIIQVLDERIDLFISKYLEANG